MSIRESGVDIRRREFWHAECRILVTPMLPGVVAPSAAGWVNLMNAIASDRGWNVRGRTTRPKAHTESLLLDLGRNNINNADFSLG